MHHGAGLRALTKNDTLVEALVRNWREAPLDAPDRAMLDYIEKLTREPWTMQQEDVERLSDAGFDDSAILDICQVAAYYAFVNRIADGLGVDLEENEESR